MKNNYLKLYLEINYTDLIFFVGENDLQNNFKIIYKLKVPIIGLENNRISNFEKFSNIIKENIYLIEQKFNYTFREIILILENFNSSFINLSGYKRLNGSQILRENIIYILNTLKSCVSKVESKKTILHIFNSKFNLDNKKIDNLPIGLFGDFYSHELSFILINTNDYNNLKNIFNKCNLNIKKTLIKSFIEGASTSDHNKNIDTFFHIQINDESSKIFYFENDTLKFEQSFKFGNKIVIQDISKITSLKKEIIEKIWYEQDLNEKISDEEFVEAGFFGEENYKKIKKKLIYQIAFSRIKEISELMLFKNINLKHYNNLSKVVFFKLNSKLQLKSLGKMYKTIFSMGPNLDFRFLDNLSKESMLNTANKLAHFGWRKEAIPVTQTKKSLIRKLFDAIFG